MTFTVARSDDVMVPLMVGGAQKPVTEENLEQYCDLAESYRCHEFDQQVRKECGDTALCSELCIAAV